MSLLKALSGEKRADAAQDARHSPGRPPNSTLVPPQKESETVTSKRLQDVMRDLYWRAIDCSIKSQSDGGFVVSLKDKLHGSKTLARKTFPADELDRAAEWLERKCWQFYPKP